MNNILKLATPISHLFEDDAVAQEIITFSDCLECRERNSESNWSKQYLFHIDVDIIHGWKQPLKDYLKTLLIPKRELKLVSFQMTVSCDQPTKVKEIYQFGGEEFLPGEMLENAATNIAWLRSILNKNITIALENNNYYPTPAYRHVTEGKFITSVVKENNLKFLFDIAHAQITSHNRDIDYEEYCNSLPMDKTVQLHICEPGINREGLAYDAHDLPEEKMVEHVCELVKKYPVTYLTIEYYKDKDKLIKSLKQFQQIKNLPV